MEQTLNIKETKVPVIGLGTWNLTGSKCIYSVENALSMGYRHIDTARIYDNEYEVGIAIKNSNLPRNEIYLVTKIPPGELEPSGIEKAAHDSLKKLKTEYVDLVLIHWPYAGMNLEKTLNAMYNLVISGKVKSIGVSNFSAEEFRKSIEFAPIVCNQVLFHPFHPQNENVKVALENNLFVTAYTPFANGSVFKNQTINSIAKKYNKTAAQITLRWLIQHGNTVVIPKAAREEYRKSNLEIFDFNLDQEDMMRIGSFQKVSS